MKLSPPKEAPPTPRYYLDSDPASAALTIDQTVIAAPALAGYYLTSAETPRRVRLTINNTANAGIGREFESYRVYRFVGSAPDYSGELNVPPLTPNLNNSFVFESWKDVTDELAWHENTDGSTGTMFAYDSFMNTQWSSSARLFYTVVGVTADGALSRPAGVSVMQNNYAAPDLALTPLGWDPEGHYRGVLINWKPKMGETYKVKRAEARYEYLDVSDTLPIGAPNYDWVFMGLVDGEWADLDMSKTFVGLDGSHGLIEEPGIRRAWHYKLEAYDEGLDDVVKGTSDVQAMTAGWYNNRIPEEFRGMISINAPALTYATIMQRATDRFPAYQTSISVNTASIARLKIWMSENESLRIYRAPLTGNNGYEKGPYEIAKTISYGDLDNFWFWDFDGGSAPELGYYRYEAQLVTDLPSEGSHYEDHIAAYALPGSPLIGANNRDHAPRDPSGINQNVVRIVPTTAGYTAATERYLTFTEPGVTNVYSYRYDGTKVVVYAWGAATQAELNNLMNVNPNGVRTELTLVPDETAPAGAERRYKTDTFSTPGNYGQVDVYYLRGDGTGDDPNSDVAIAGFVWEPDPEQ